MCVKLSSVRIMCTLCHHLSLFLCLYSSACPVCALLLHVNLLVLMNHKVILMWDFSSLKLADEHDSFY